MWTLLDADSIRTIVRVTAPQPSNELYIELYSIALSIAWLSHSVPDGGGTRYTAATVRRPPKLYQWLVFYAMVVGLCRWLAFLGGYSLVIYRGLHRGEIGLN